MIAAVNIRILMLRIICTLAAVIAATPIVARAQSSAERALGQRLVREYEKKAGIGDTPQLREISRYISRVGDRVAGALPSPHRYRFIFDPNPSFKSAFALPGEYIIVGGGILAFTATEDELANVLAHEIEHVELGQVSRRVNELTKHKSIKSLHVADLDPGYSKQEELACDLNGQSLAAKAGYSPAGMLTLLETFQALTKGAAESPSEKHPTLAERIAQAERLAKASTQKQVPLGIN